MVGMGMGFDRRGKIPFVSTFSCFFSRAYDQIRMAAISDSALRLVGSHCGVSIGQDGPSQMGLEDIAMVRAIPDSIVLYPCDAVSTYKLVEQMARYDKGISYLRTTRMDTPVLYNNDEQFIIGGCKVVRQSEKDVACIVAAGVTLHEALKAYEILAQRNVFVSVIDLYSVKPLDCSTLIYVARKSQNKIITVEDHYPQGGIGEAVLSAVHNESIVVHSLAVKHKPRSGKPEELLAFEEINAEAIVAAVIK
jgi:transketolase